MPSPLFFNIKNMMTTAVIKRERELVELGQSIAV